MLLQRKSSMTHIGSEEEGKREREKTNTVLRERGGDRPLF